MTDMGTALKLSVIESYVRMVVAVGPSYHPDSDAMDHPEHELEITHCRGVLSEWVPDLDECDLTLRVFRAQGWVP